MRSSNRREARKRQGAGHFRPLFLYFEQATKTRVFGAGDHGSRKPIQKNPKASLAHRTGSCGGGLKPCVHIETAVIHDDWRAPSFSVFFIERVKKECV